MTRRVMVAALAAAFVPAQARVSLHPAARPSSLEQQVLQLGQEPTRAPALAAMAGSARPAWPGLQQLAAGKGALAAAAAHAAGRVTRRDGSGAVLWQYPCQLASTLVPRVFVPPR